MLILWDDIALFGFALRSPACNKCLTAVDMFVYIAAREKREHRPLFPHVEQGSAVQTASPCHLQMSTCLTELTAAGFTPVTASDPI